MRVPLTKFGWPQVVLLPAGVLAAMLVCLLAAPLWLGAWAVYALAAMLAAVFVWVLAFFRDPERAVPSDRNVLLAPADGKIIGVEEVQEDEFIGAKALRITIFLSIFDVHINRAPCSVTVEKITYRPGKFKNAMNPESARVNESNDLWLTRTDRPNDKLIVRQISGAIARRIVCTAKPGQSLTAGERFGMIKFGSGTEIYLPAGNNAKCLVKVGDKVKAGLSAVVRYE